MRRAIVWLFVALAVVVGGWWMSDTTRGSANLEPLPAEPVAREAVREVELVAPDPEPVRESSTEAPPTAPTERVPVGLESISSSPLLRVRVFDARGEPWLEPTRIPADGGRSPEQPWREVEWPTVLSVVVFERDDLGGLGSTAGRRLREARAVEGKYEYVVSEGMRYLVGATGPGFDGSVREVDVPRGSGGAVVDLHARDLGELALLSVRVTQYGRELRGGMDEAPFRIELQGRLGQVLLEMPCDVLQAPFLLRVPAGEYRLVGFGIAETQSSHGYVGQRRSLGRCERQLEVTDGQDEELVLEMGGVGKLQVTLEGRVEEADLVAVRKQSWLGASMDEAHEREEELRRRSALAELSVISSELRREPVLLFTLTKRRTGGLGFLDDGSKHLLNEWPLAATSTSECLPTGRHTLIARLPGGREARAEVELFEGRTTPVRLRF